MVGGPIVPGCRVCKAGGKITACQKEAQKVLLISLQFFFHSSTPWNLLCRGKIRWWAGNSHEAELYYTNLPQDPGQVL